VKDEGIGIPEKDQKHLFRALYRASNVGTVPGIGAELAIIKHAIDLHGGTITVVSDVEMGTTFTVEIPICSDSETIT